MGIFIGRARSLQNCNFISFICWPLKYSSNGAQCDTYALVYSKAQPCNAPPVIVVCTHNYSRKVYDAKAKQMGVTWQWLCDEENCAMFARRAFEGDDRSYGNWKSSSCWFMQSLDLFLIMLVLWPSLDRFLAYKLVLSYSIWYAMEDEAPFRGLPLVCVVFHFATHENFLQSGMRGLSLEP